MSPYREHGYPGDDSWLEGSPVSKRHKYKKAQTITAVQLDLATKGFTYDKWGHEQVCKRGDWIVDNCGDIYTISSESFAATYQLVSPGRYVKTTPVWAEVAGKAGKKKTKEGFTDYEPGDYVVSNNEDGSDPYAVSKAKFEEMYELVKEDDED